MSDVVDVLTSRPFIETVLVLVVTAALTGFLVPVVSREWTTDGFESSSCSRPGSPGREESSNLRPLRSRALPRPVGVSKADDGGGLPSRGETPRPIPERPCHVRGQGMGLFA